MKSSEYELVTTPFVSGHTPCHQCIFNDTSVNPPPPDSNMTVCLIAALERRSLMATDHSGDMDGFFCQSTNDVISLAHRISGKLVDPIDVVELYKEPTNE